MQMMNDILKKARETTSSAELFHLAKENDMEISMEEADRYFQILHVNTELSDRELSDVAGGGCPDTQLYCPYCQKKTSCFQIATRQYICDECNQVFIK